MRLCTLAGERELLVTDETIYDNGCEMTGAEVAGLMAQLDRARLAILWRELHQSIPRGCWVISSQHAFEGPARVIDFRYGAPGSPGHEVRVAVSSGRPTYVDAAGVEVVPAPGETTS